MTTSCKCYQRIVFEADGIVLTVSVYGMRDRCRVWYCAKYTVFVGIVGRRVCMFAPIGCFGRVWFQVQLYCGGR